jgi:hypothetical protein
MCKPMKDRRAFVLGCVVLFGCLVLVQPAHGQLSLLSSTPADGDTEVDTLITMTLEFSAPLDTTARFEEPGGLFLGLEAFPFEAVSEPQGEIILSPDSTVVTVVDIPLEPERTYIFVLTGARSASGEMLDRPYVWTFSTGSILPQGTVSGTVSFPGGDPGGTAVGLFKEPPFAPGEEDEGSPDLWGGGVVPLSSSDYTAQYVPAGSYYVIGLKDANRDGNFHFPGDAFGGYDADDDNMADLITLAAGQSLADIDLTIGLSPDVTARETFPGAEDVAQAQFPDAQLSVLVAAPVSQEGTSQNWLYGFYSAMEDSLFGVSQVGETFFLFSFPVGGDDGPTILADRALPEGWIDSDMAADTAEAYVGREFRDQYPDAEATGFAATLTFPDDGSMAPANRRTAGWPAAVSSADDLGEPSFSAMASQDTFAVWVFFYRSQEADEETNILLDVETGSPIFPGPWQLTSARDNLDTADSVAAGWATDAALVILGNIHTVTPEGLADAWGFGYYSALKDSILSLFIASNIVTDQETDSTHVVPSLEPLPPGWLDSPVVTPIADAASGDFRNQHPDAWVVTQLSRELWPSDPSLAVWRFMYWSDADTIELNIYVDALTGDIVTGLDEPAESANIPRSFALKQNYPNPFNPRTTIQYYLPQDAYVEIAIFNLLGQRVLVLVEEAKPAGSHQVRWDGSDDLGQQVSSGIYFCRMKAGGFVKTKKMILVR